MITIIRIIMNDLHSLRSSSYVFYDTFGFFNKFATNKPHAVYFSKKKRFIQDILGTAMIG